MPRPGRHVTTAVRRPVDGWLAGRPAAINDGAIFRFLWKPVEPEDMEVCLRDAVAQHRPVTAERELLEQTLNGSVRALLETLSLANPLAFSRAERIRARVTTILERLGLPEPWEIELAAMLSQLGAVTLPPVVVESLHKGDVLTPHVRRQVERLPTLSADLLADVPRLEEVRRSILFQDQRYDGRGDVTNGMAGEEVPLGARVLRVAVDYDALEARGTRITQAIATLRADRGRYDPAVLEALELAVTTDADAQPVDQIRLDELTSGMVLAADLRAEGDLLLCGRGQEVTDRIVGRVRNWAEHYTIEEPILVHRGGGGA